MASIPHQSLNIRAIAELAKVSTSTVSRVLNGSGYVGAEARTRVETVIAETGYTPSNVAKTLKSRRTDTVGIIIPRINSYASSQITAGMASVLAANDFVTVLGNSANQSRNELDYLEMFRRQRVSGVLMLATEITPAHVVGMKALGVPVVVTGQDASEHGFASVLQDERTATHQITDLLVRCGHRRIGLIGVADWDVQVGCERKRGFFDALRAADLPRRDDDVVLGGFDLHDGATGADRLLPFAGPDHPTAIVAVTDRLAIGAMSRLSDRRIDIPGDVSVVGMGDIDMAAVYRPKLTTIRFDYFATGETAARQLVALMRGDTANDPKTIMPFDLRVRESAR